MVDMKKLRELVKLMTANDLTELDLQGEGERITLKRAPAGGAPVVYHQPAPVAAHPPAAAPTAVTAPAAPNAVDTAGLHPIASPMVGTFYAASSPDAKPFANVGDAVDDDTVVCIIEAMKVFNEIRAECKGVIEKVLVENGQAVEFGQPLFLVNPEP